MTSEHDLELVDRRVRPHQLLDAPRVHDDAPHLLHVVEAAEHAALEGDQRASAWTLAVGHLHDVASPVPDEGHGLAIEAREDELAALARTDGPVLLVQHLRIAVVLVHVRQTGSRVALEAPRRDLGETRQIVGLGSEGRLDPGSGRGDRCAGLARVPRDANARVLGEVDALLRGGLGEEERVGRRAAEHGDRVVQERVDALIGREAADREDETAEILRRVEAAPVADPRPIREGRHHHVLLPDSVGVEGPRVRMVEAVPVLARIEEGERAPGRRRRQVNAHDVSQRDGEHVAPGRSGGLVFLQLVLGGEGETAKIVEAPDPRRLDACGLELAAVERAVRGGVTHLLAQAQRLPPRHGGARPALDLGFEVAGGHR